MKKIVLSVEGMTCSACSSGLEKYLQKQKGVISANVNLVLSLVTIEYENINKKILEQYIKEAGFKSAGEFNSITENNSSKQDKVLLIILGLLIILTMYISMGHMINLPSFPWINHFHPVVLATFLFIISIVFIIYGFDIIKNGFKNIMHLLPNMDSLVMFSVLFSFLYSLWGYIMIILGYNEYINNLYFESTCMIIYFIKLGRFIENKSKDKTKEAIKSLVQITPQNANMLKEGKIIKVNIDEVQKGDILVCKSGDKIAVDGTVVKGKTYVDESFITGESKLVCKEKGSKVIAGSISYDGYIEYEAQKIGKESTISEIVKMVVDATNSKNKIQIIADKVCSYFVPTIFLLAILTFIIHLLLGFSFEPSLIHMITVLAVACPCALGLAVPLVLVVSNGICAKKGIFLKNGLALEITKDIDTIVLDKTGTLTYGTLKIFKTFTYGVEEKELLNIVANIESKSSHPIRRAFEIAQNLEVTNFKTIPGVGVKAKIKKDEYVLGNEKAFTKGKKYSYKKEDYDYLLQNGCTIIFAFKNDKVIGLIGLRDILRIDDKKVVEKFYKHNLDVIMLTGDNEASAKIIASELGIKKVIASVLPSEKASCIKKLINDGKKVMMVGDGINDAPALTLANVGVSINSATDVAMNSSDVILMNNNLKNILDLITISQKAYKVIIQNLFGAFFYNVVMLPIAMGFFSKWGIEMNPMLGSIAMTLSSITVVLNSLRFRRVMK